MVQCHSSVYSSHFPGCHTDITDDRKLKLHWNLVITRVLGNSFGRALHATRVTSEIDIYLIWDP